MFNKILLLLLVFLCLSSCKIELTKPTEEIKKKKSDIPKYNRKSWKHWIDTDKDCQNERAEQLIDTSLDPITFKTEKKCLVLEGKWIDPYTNQQFVLASKLDIDHLIPLKEAHVSGGYKWTKEEKRVFANDPENLVVASASANRQKGTKNPAQWLPKNESFHCEYVYLWVELKEKYILSIDLDEEIAINSVLKTCRKNSSLPLPY